MYTGLVLPAKPIPQLYGDPYGEHEDQQQINSGSHKGSCLSASFEMIDAYQGRGIERKYSTISCNPGRAQPNYDPHFYCWNQATIHHYVWSSKRRLLELATSEISNWEGFLRYAVMTVSMPGEGPTWRMNRVFHGELGRGRIYDYWEVTKAALECNRMPIVSVKSMRMAPPRPMPEPENRDPEEDYDWIQIPTEEIPELETDGFPNNQYPLYEEKNGWAPVYGIGEGNPNRPGHAMVISGYMIENEGPLEERYVRLLDPSPSMRLRANPMKMYEPDLFAKDPRNHIKWVRWRDLEAVIREQMGLLIFSADSRYFDPNLPTPAMEEYFLDSTTPDRSRGNVPIGW